MVPAKVAGRDQLTEMAVILEALVVKVAEISGKLDTLKDDKVGDLIVQQAVQGGRLDRVEKIVYGLVALVAANLIALIGGFILWKLQRP